MRESDVEAYLVKRVKELGGEVRKVKWIGRRGAPDRLVMLPVPYVRLKDGAYAADWRKATTWVELKAPGEKLDLHQAREHQRMRKMGQRVEMVDSFERVDEILR